MIPREISRPVVLLGPVLLLFAVLFVYPLVHTVSVSLSGEGGPGFGNYISFLTRGGGGRIILLTAALALSTALLSTAVSLFLLGVVPRAGALRTAALSLVLLPVVVPGLVMALGLLLLWDDVGWVSLFLEKLGLPRGSLPVNYTPQGLVLFYTWLYFPFTALAVFSRWEAVPRDAIAAARVCGAGHWRLVRSIILPLLLPGILTGASMSFMLAFGAFSVPLICGGDTTPLAVGIYRTAVVFGAWGEGAAGAVLMAASQLAILGIFLGRGKGWRR